MKVLLVTPPFTQLNTAYPATAYLKGFLNNKDITSFQLDLSIETMSRVFSSNVLKQMIPDMYEGEDEVLMRMVQFKSQYCHTIDEVMAFLRGKQPTLAHKIISRNYLPESFRFQEAGDLEFSFGSSGVADMAKHLATLYLEDIGDYIQKHHDPHFGFNRYAESLARAASDFTPIENELHAPSTLITTISLQILEEKMEVCHPDVVCFTIPFPGNLFAALRGAAYLKKNYPGVSIIAGGGYVNTELRKMSDERLFKYFDFLCFDDGEMPLLSVLEHLSGERPMTSLKRTMLLNSGVVQWIDGATEKDIPQRETGTPDYSDLPLDLYFSILEIANPMHRLWSDGRWNKLTLAHGCYWGKCSFCDISLDYIGRYEPITATMICDRIETIIQQTGHNGFHFVDEAAPPSLMTELAIELIQRKIDISWWTNIRFEKSFTTDVCQLLAKSGCIAVTGGLEVASDRLLTLMKKGVTVEQVSKVAHNFTKAGIMVHAYLMYGFPTQTAQETIDSLEVVRQLFEAGVLQSGFWHRFAMTAHSPVGLTPKDYLVTATGPSFAGFAENDLFHEDPTGCHHDDFSEGLRISLYNYMNATGFDLPLQKWFDIKVPKPTHAKNLIQKFIERSDDLKRNITKIYYLGTLPHKIKSPNPDYQSMKFYIKQEAIEVDIPIEEARWLEQILQHLLISSDSKTVTYHEFKTTYEENTQLDFDEMMASDFGVLLREAGLVMV